VVRPTADLAFALQILTIWEVGWVLAVADRAQQGFFDAGWCGKVVPRDSFYGLLAEHGERIVSGEDFAGCYSASRGRPSIPPSLLAKILLLAYRTGLSDRQAMEAVRFDLRWKVALGLPLDHEGFHPTSLVKFRARLLLHGKERVVFERSLALAHELGVLGDALEQVVDSTPMLGAAATQDTVTLVRSGVRKLLDALAGEDAEAAATLGRHLAFDYAKPRQKPDCDWRSKPAREQLLMRVAQDAERALRALERVPELVEALPVAEAARLLRELIGQDFELDENDVPRLRRGTAKQRILSVHDPEMRHGRKSERQRFDGYKIHAAASVGKQPLLTAIDVSPGCDYDGQMAPVLVDAQPERLRPTRLLGDSAYGDSETREQLEQRQVEVLAPVPEPPPLAGRIGKRDFKIDLIAGTVICPAGEVARIGKPQRSGMRAAVSPIASAGPAHSKAAAPLAGAGARSTCAAAKISCKLGARRSAIRPRASTCAGHARASSAYSAYSSTATTAARAATEADAKPASRPPGLPSSSTSTRSRSPSPDPRHEPKATPTENRTANPATRRPHALSRLPAHRLLQRPSRRTARGRCRGRRSARRYHCRSVSAGPEPRSSPRSEAAG
jgi:transposase